MSIQPIEGMWQYHYRLALALTKKTVGLDIAHEMGVEVVVYPEVLRRLLESQWDEARMWCQDHAAILTKEGFRADGLRVTAGDLWRQPFEEGV